MKFDIIINKGKIDEKEVTVKPKVGSGWLQYAAWFSVIYIGLRAAQGIKQRSSKGGD